MVTIEPQILSGVIGSAITMIAGGLAVWLRSSASSRAYDAKSRADGYTTQENAKASANDALIDIAKQGIVFQQQMIKVVEDSTRANEKSAAEMRGMVAMMDGFGTVLKNAVLGIDETQAHITSIHSDTAAIKNTTDSLETNLGESIKGQFGPVVEELKNIGTQISVLVVDIQSRDGHTNTRLAELVVMFKDAERRFMSMLEPIVVKHMAGLTTDGVPQNGHSEVQELPVKISIESTAKE